jgi:hypothetical protein
MATLYEINNAILDCIDENGEIIDEERLATLQIEKNEKIEGVALWYKNLLSDAEQYEKEKKHFEQLQKQAERKAERLKIYLRSALDGEKFKTTKVNISYRTSRKVIVDDVTQIDEMYLKPPKEREADKVALKKVLETGEYIAGVHLEENRNISIK